MALVRQYDVVTVTLNPAIDQTLFLGELRPGEVNRADRVYTQPAGKGVNVATMLAMGGAQVAVSGLLGSVNSSIFERHFDQFGLSDRFVRVDAAVRNSIKIVDTWHGTTDVNVPGFSPTREQCDELKERLADLAAPGRWFVIAGSMPPGVETDYFIELILMLQARECRVAVDSSGDALKAAIRVGVDFIKPNRSELEDVLGQALPDLHTVVEAVCTQIRGKVEHVVVSMGREGALFVTPDSKLLAAAPPASIVSTVGAGDSLLAGYLQGLMRGHDPRYCARLASVYAWCCLESLETELPSEELMEHRFEQIKVSEV